MPLTMFYLGSGQCSKDDDIGKAVINYHKNRALELEKATPWYNKIAVRAKWFFTPFSPEPEIGMLTPTPKPKESINTSFYNAVVGDKRIFAGPVKWWGIYHPEIIQRNVEQSLAAIQGYFKNEMSKPEKDRDFRINLSGFSRGSATCHKVANALQAALNDKTSDISKLIGEEYKKVALNLSVEDPVAGSGDKSDINIRIIPPIVKNYVATFQMHEVRVGFKPQDNSRLIFDHASTKVTLLPLYGNHSDSNKVKDNFESALLNWQLKYDLLKNNGTRFKDNKIPQLVGDNENIRYIIDKKLLPSLNGNDDEVLTQKKLLELYSHKKNKINDYARKGFSIQWVDIPLPGQERSFVKRLDQYVIDKFFINQHERELFKLSYPIVFNYLFEKGLRDPFRSGGNYSKADKEAEFKEMQASNPELFSRLNNEKKIEFVKKTQQYDFVGQPGGIEHIEQCHFLSDKSPSEKPCKVINDLEKEIAQATIRYQRDKFMDKQGNSSSLLSIVYSIIYSESQRSHYDLCDKVRKEIRTIMTSNLKEPEIIKKNKMLTHIKLIVEDLKSKGSTSDLTAALDVILIKNKIAVDMKPKKYNILTYVGIGIRGLGKAIQILGQIFSASIIKGTGKGLMKLGERTVNVLKYRSLGVETVLLAILSSPLLVLYPLGFVMSHVGSLIDKWIAPKIKNAGEALMKASGTYKVSVKKLTREEREERLKNLKLNVSPVVKTGSKPVNILPSAAFTGSTATVISLTTPLLKKAGGSDASLYGEKDEKTVARYPEFSAALSTAVTADAEAPVATTAATIAAAPPTDAAAPPTDAAAPPTDAAAPVAPGGESFKPQ